MKNPATFLLVIVQICLHCSMVFAQNQTSFCVDDFASTPDPKIWQASDGAKWKYENNSIIAEWPKYESGSDSRWPGVTREMPGVDFSRYNGLRVDLSNPTDHLQPLQVNIRDRQGRQTIVVASVPPKTRRKVDVVFDRMSTGAIDFSDVERVSFYRTEPSRAFVWQIHGLELFADRPSQTLHGQLQAIHQRTGEVYRQAVSQKLLNASQSGDAEKILMRWKNAIESPETLSGKAEAARTELMNLQSSLLIKTLNVTTKQPLIAWTVPLGTKFQPGESLLDFEKPADSVNIVVARNEYEDAIVRLTNLTNQPQSLRITLESQQPESLKLLSLRRNQIVRAVDGSLVGDALVTLDESNAVELAPESSMELWLRVDTKSSAPSPGKHAAQLVVRDLRAASITALRLPVSVDVLNVDLTHGKPLRSTLYQGVSPVYQYRTIFGHEEEAVQNMADYGINVFTLWPEPSVRQSPYPKLTPSGELAAPVDYSEHDRVIALYRKYVPDAFFNLCLNFDMKADAPNWTLRNDLEPGSQAWQRGMKAWLSDWAAHLKSLGVPTSHYAFYLSDEPDVSELDRYRQVAKIIRSIDPSIQIFCNGSELYNDPALDRELIDAVDVWNPNDAGLLANPDLLPALRKLGEKDIWVYECRVGTRARVVNWHDYYRLMTWRALRDGLTGVGYWHYCYRSDPKEDPWDGTSASDTEAFLVYPGSSHLLMSVRFELFREALEDARLFDLLRQLPSTDKGASDLMQGKLKDAIAHPENPALSSEWRMNALRVLRASGTK